MKYVGKLFGQIGRTRGYFDTGKTSDDWDVLEARAERAEAELATERARLDWLESKCPILWSLADHATGPYWLLTDFPGYTEETASQHKTARAAIDAAMKEGA